MTSPMLAAVRAQSPDLCWLSKVTWPDVTEIWSDESVPSASLGQALGIIEGIDNYDRGSDDKNRSLSGSSLTIHFLDNNYRFRKRLASAFGRLQNAPVVVQLAGGAPLVPADYCTVFAGIVAGYGMSSATSGYLKCRTDDRKLKGSFGRVINQAIWPNASREALSTMEPIVYGTFDSGADGGAVPCPLVDRSQNWYLVSVGHAKSVDRVYVDGVQQTAGFTVVYPLQGGRRYTVIQFTASQMDKAVTADVQGLEATGDGSGALITNPADMLKHLLVNFVYGFWLDGAWLADATAPVSTTYFSETATLLSGRKAARRISGVLQPDGTLSLKGIDEVNRFCQTWPVYPLWTWDGQLAIRFPNPFIDPFFDSPMLIGGVNVHNADDGYTEERDFQTMVSRIEVHYLRNEVLNSFQQDLTVEDPSIPGGSADQINMHYGHAGV
jgi:hypothetical protein